VGGAAHDRVGDASGVADVGEGGDGTSTASRAVHDAGVELDDAIFIR